MINFRKSLFVLPVSLLLNISGIARADGPAVETPVENPDTVAIHTMPATSFGRITAEIGDLIRLKINDSGGMALNRDVWNILTSKSKKERYSEILKDLQRNTPFPDDDFYKERAQEMLEKEAKENNSGVQAFKMFYRRMPYTLGYGGGGDPKAGFSWHFETGSIFARMNLKEGEGVSIRLSDKSDTLAQPFISVREKDAGDFMLFVFYGEDGPMLTIKQVTGKNFSITLLRNGVETKRIGESFKELLGKDEAFFRKDIFPLLTNVGIRLPAIHDQILIDSVMKLLAFDADSGLLTMMLQNYKDGNPSGPEKSAEPNAGLGKAIIGAPEVRELSIVVGLGLLDDAEFLSQILPKLTNEKDKMLVANRLAVLSEKDI